MTKLQAFWYVISWYFKIVYGIIFAVTAIDIALYALGSTAYIVGDAALFMVAPFTCLASPYVLIALVIAWFINWEER